MNASTPMTRASDRLGDRRLFVPVETKVRELDAKLLFSLAAAEAGWIVVMGHQEDLQRSLFRFPRGLYLDKSVTVSKQEWFAQCRAMGHRIAAWDEEGLVYFDAETMKAMRLDETALAQIDVFFAWGDHQKDSMLATLPHLSTDVQVTGNPRFDLLRPEFRGLYDDSTRRLRGEHGRLILVNTSFPFANHFLGKDAMHAMYAKYPITRRHPHFFKEWAEVHAAALGSFRQLIPLLSAAFPEHTIVVRPHPSENHESWLKWLADVPRVKVLARGPVVEWIAAADFTVHFDCTSGIEAFVMNAVAIAFDEETVHGYRQPLPNALSLRAHTVDEVIALGRKAVEGELASAFGDPPRMQTARRHIAALDGALAVDRIVGALDTRPPVSRGESLRRLRTRLNGAYVMVRDDLRRRRNGDQGSYLSQKFPHTTVQEIEQRAAALGAAVGRFETVRICGQGRNCFELRRKR